MSLLHHRSAHIPRIRRIRASLLTNSIVHGSVLTHVLDNPPSRGQIGLDSKPEVLSHHCHWHRSTVSVKASGSVALANQVFKISWQWLASGFSGSIIQVFKMGLVVGNLAWRNVEFGKFRLRRPFYEGACPLDPRGSRFVFLVAEFYSLSLSA